MATPGEVASSTVGTAPRAADAPASPPAPTPLLKAGGDAATRLAEAAPAAATLFDAPEASLSAPPASPPDTAGGGPDPLTRHTWPHRPMPNHVVAPVFSALPPSAPVPTPLSPPLPPGPVSAKFPIRPPGLASASFGVPPSAAPPAPNAYVYPGVWPLESSAPGAVRGAVDVGEKAAKGTAAPFTKEGGTFPAKPPTAPLTACP